MYSLKLNANPIGWRVFCARKTDDNFSRFARKVFERDGHTCQFCGFESTKYQEVTNLDQNYFNNKLSNLVTTCCLCLRCTFLASAGEGGYGGGGTLIFLPEMTQNHINSLCHVLFCAIACETGYKFTAQNIYRNFKLRSQVVEQRLGEGISQPEVFGRLLIESQLSDASSKSLGNILEGLRLLPSRSDFKTQIEYWAPAVIKKFTMQEPDPKVKLHE